MRGNDPKGREDPIEFHMPLRTNSKATWEALRLIGDTDIEGVKGRQAHLRLLGREERRSPMITKLK